MSDQTMLNCCCSPLKRRAFDSTGVALFRAQRKTSTVELSVAGEGEAAAGAEQDIYFHHTEAVLE